MSNSSKAKSRTKPSSFKLSTTEIQLREVELKDEEFEFEETNLRDNIPHSANNSKLVRKTPSKLKDDF